MNRQKLENLCKYLEISSNGLTSELENRILYYYTNINDNSKINQLKYSQNTNLIYKFTLIDFDILSNILQFLNDLNLRFVSKRFSNEICKKELLKMNYFFVQNTFPKTVEMIHITLTHRTICRIISKKNILRIKNIDTRKIKRKKKNLNKYKILF